ncbi:hypothetical protein WA158_004802 [Blastocystis sp. Blastoise]
MPSYSHSRSHSRSINRSWHNRSNDSMDRYHSSKQESPMEYSRHNRNDSAHRSGHQSRHEIRNHSGRHIRDDYDENHSYNYDDFREYRHRKYHRAPSRYYSPRRYHTHQKSYHSYNDDYYPHHNHHHTHHHQSHYDDHHHTSSHESKRKDISSSYSSGYSNEKEDLKHFKPTPNEIINNRYKVIKELGTGTFAKVFEVIDMNDQQVKALKVVRDIPRYKDSAETEARYLKDVNEKGNEQISHIVKYYDSFDFHGHYCICQELLGQSLYAYLKNNEYHSYPLYQVQHILKQLLECLQFLASIQMSHTDLKPENLLFVNDTSKQQIDSKGKSFSCVLNSDIRIVDFGGATYDSESKARIINTRQYRGPEVILELPWDSQSDIWSAACIAMELYTGDLLFQTHNNLHHLSLMEHFMGPFPMSMVSHAARHIREYFDDAGHVLLTQFANKKDIAHVRHSKSLEELIEDADFLDLIRHMLIYNPKERYTASDALKHPFFTKHIDESICFTQ